MLKATSILGNKYKLFIYFFAMPSTAALERGNGSTFGQSIPDLLSYAGGGGGGGG